MATDKDLLLRNAVFEIGLRADPNVADALLKIENQWNDLDRIAKSDKASAEEKAQAKRGMDALAKGLPALAIGIRDAAKAFKSGDAFAGSAAIMDLCGTLAATVGALSVAGGPPGAVVAAIFSVVSMVLKMFVQEQASLASQIEKMMRTIRAEEESDQLAAAQDSIMAYIASEDKNSKARITSTYDESVAKLNLIDGAAIGYIRLAAHWLKRPDNLDLPLWGQILAAQCQTYIMLMQALFISGARFDRNTPDGQKHFLQLAADFESNHPIQLAFLRDIMPAARARGVLWHIGIFSTGRWGDSGPLRVRDTAKPAWTNHDGVARVFTITKMNTGAGSQTDPFPELAAFRVEGDGYVDPGLGTAYRYRKNAGTFGWCGRWPMTRTTGWHELPDLRGLYDICATPGVNEREVFLYTANGDGIDRYKHDDDHATKGMKVERSKDFSFPVPSRHKVDSVCAVARPRTIPDEDPRVLQNPRAALDDDWVVYGGLESNGQRSLRALFSGGAIGDFECPQEATMTGMAIDSKRLWVFTRRFIACATHASLKHYITTVKTFDWVLYNRGARPDWAYYNIPDELHSAQMLDPKIGLQDVAACDDGTLTAVFGVHTGQGNATKVTYMATPTFDRPNKGVLIVGTKRGDHGRPVATHGWTQLEDKAHRVYKQPIFCWSLVEGLASTLERTTRADEGLLLEQA